MTVKEVFQVVEEQLGVSKKAILTSQRSAVVDAKDIVIIMLHEEGLTSKEIERAVRVSRSLVSITINIKADHRLRLDQRFKTKYLACIAGMAQKEMQHEEN